MAPVEVRRAADRYRTEAEGRATAHSFSFGAHYDPANVSFGALVAHNDELLPPGTGYGPHPHEGVEIVTWVVSGALRHQDDHGHDAVLAPGSVQVLYAGAGVVHSEVSAADVPTRFVQAWLRSDDLATEPTYASTDVTTDRGAWVALAGEGGLPLRTPRTGLLLGTPTSRPLPLPVAPRLHVFVVGGDVQVADTVLHDGDALRLHGADLAGLAVTALAGTPHLLAWLLP